MTHVQEIIASEWPMYHSSYICCTHVPETHVLPKILCVFWYIDVLTCMTVKTPRTKLLVVCHEDYRWRQVDEAQTHGLSLLRQWSCSGPKLVTAPVWNNWWADCTAILWHSYWHRHDSACMLIVGCWAVQCRYITDTAGSYHRSMKKLCN